MDDPTPDTPIQPSEKQMFLTLRKLGASDDEAFAFVQGTENMAGRIIIAEIRAQSARLDAAIEVQNARLEAQQREINSLRWMIGLGFTGLAILITVLTLLG